MTRFARRAALSAGLTLALAVGVADAATMSPHRATYAISSASGVGQKQAQVIDGLMVFEGGWVDQRDRKLLASIKADLRAIGVEL